MIRVYYSICVADRWFTGAILFKSKCALKKISGDNQIEKVNICLSTPPPSLCGRFSADMPQTRFIRLPFTQILNRI